ncbi:hypothetical protein [Pseudacidovorax sp. RU35E]|uniref:hypothetical protein n=1 Tax=Pseudacidovorax sp. RU35E TaxID=1907403 RepID=UPI0009572C63|nr:hypothetical protein [Pseudacidovorax sp. RU35E]SIR70589.1 hypothetical protein SAMN05880557_11737 [Pseudacidovorax sp. RU35E]
MQTWVRVMVAVAALAAVGAMAMHGQVRWAAALLAAAGVLLALGAWAGRLRSTRRRVLSYVQVIKPPIGHVEHRQA